MPYPGLVSVTPPPSDVVSAPPLQPSFTIRKCRNFASAFYERCKDFKSARNPATLDTGRNHEPSELAETGTVAPNVAGAGGDVGPRVRLPEPVACIG